MKKYTISTFGCQMNEHDSEKISWILEDMGYTPTDDIEESDFIVYNTCVIRKSAEEKVYGQLGHLKDLKRRRPDLIIALCGCMMQREDVREVITSKHKHVDIIFGTHNIHKLPQLIYSNKQTGKTVIDILEENKEIEDNIDANRTHSYKAYVNIMYGCNNFCTYCIVPYVRGREQSREPENIIKEIEALAASGCKEVTLLGQNVNSYGNTLGGDYSFADLLKAINEIEGLERIRFMTSHPKDLSNDVIDSYIELDKLCNHLHLPVQSGSNSVLHSMNRKYTKEDYMKIIDKIKKIEPKIAITTDIIVGFPGETEEDFQETLDLVQECKFDSAYTFLYSPREGTKAAEMKTQVPDDVKHKRFNRLLDMLYPIGLEKNEELIGETLQVLVEEVSKNNEEFLSGRSENAKLVHFKGDPALIGTIVPVKIESCTTFTLQGILV